MRLGMYFVVKIVSAQTAAAAAFGCGTDYHGDDDGDATDYYRLVVSFVSSTLRCLH